MEVLSILVILIAILQFFAPTAKWKPPAKILSFIGLVTLSIFIFSNKDSFYLEEHKTLNGYGTAIQNTSPDEFNYNVSQTLAPAAATNPPPSLSQTQQVQAESTSSGSTPYNIYRSSKVLNLKRGKHYPYICDPEIKNCLGFTMKFSYQLPEGNYVKNVWLVCVRENGDGWVQVGEITINEGEEKEFKIRFDRVISFTEIVIQRPIDYNDYMHTDSLSIYDIIYN